MAYPVGRPSRKVGGCMKKGIFLRVSLNRLRKEVSIGKLILGETIDLADRLSVRVSDIVIAEAMEVHS